MAFDERTRMLVGKEGVNRLAEAKVAVFGLGGVGGYAFEALVRAGVGHIDVIDGDRFSESNLNRQLLALKDTVGRPKTQVAAERAASITDTVRVNTYFMFVTPDSVDRFDFAKYDYVVDAIDTVTAKIALIRACAAAGTPVISCMGTGNKLDPTAFEVADISKTSVCPLARVMRKELGKRGIRHLKVVYSREEARTPQGWEEEAAALGKRQIPGSLSFVPGVAGLILAGEVIKDLALASDENKEM